MRKGRIMLLIGLVLLSSAVLAPAAGKLVIYNAGSVEMGEDLTRAFKAKNPGIDVELIRLGSGEIITRVDRKSVV